ncbi:MAG: polyphosphate kinase 2, partial [Planctomycetota bacterium]
MASSNGAVLDPPPTPTIDDRVVPKHVRKVTRSARKGRILGNEYPYKKKIKTEKYEKEKQQLQVELLKLQHWVEETGERLVLLFEGRDAAGKGGTIKRFMEHLNPRAARVVALGKPTEVERGQWYFQRYIDQLP